MAFGQGWVHTSLIEEAEKKNTARRIDTGYAYEGIRYMLINHSVVSQGPGELWKLMMNLKLQFLCENTHGTYTPILTSDQRPHSLSSPQVVSWLSGSMGQQTSGSNY